MANISEFHGTLTVSEQVFELDSFAKVWRQLLEMQVYPSAVDSYLKIEQDYEVIDNSRIYQICGGAEWTFDNSVNFLFAQFSIEYERDALYQKMLQELAKSKLTLPYQIAEYEPGYEILNEEHGKLQVVDGKLTAEMLEVFQYNFVPKNILKLGFEV